VLRRVHVSTIHPGDNPLTDSQAHHLRDVLRLEQGTTIQLFDDTGLTAAAVIKNISPDAVIVHVTQIDRHESTQSLTMAVAVPKGERADWMIEKLSELGVSRYVPLTTDRGVVKPGGANKIDRWKRLAIESAKQSRRPGVMEIAPLLTLRDALISTTSSWYCSTAAGSTPIMDAPPPPENLWLFVGPEGGWSPQEIEQFQQAKSTPIALTETILRVETAAITAAAVLACRK
jgi:16S rRNA (uracil1498-N3)-methyltransferase